MHGFLKLDWHERLTGSLPDWCGDTLAEDHARWCFEPATIVAAAAATISAAGAISAGQASKRQFAFTAAVQRQQAEREAQIAAVEEQRHRIASERQAGTIRARLAASGIDPGSGTALLVQEDFAQEAELDALLIRSGGEARASTLLNEAELSGAKGSAAATAGFAKAGSTLLTSEATGKAANKLFS